MALPQLIFGVTEDNYRKPQPEESKTHTPKYKAVVLTTLPQRSVVKVEKQWFRP
jgi:hypothetical protein